MNASRPVTVWIEGITEPATFSRLPDALAALWDAIRVLPLGWTQYEAYRYFLGAGAVERVTDFLDRDGQLTLSFTLAERSHVVQVTRESNHQGRGELRDAVGRHRQPPYGRSLASECAYPADRQSVPLRAPRRSR